jgi:hypothetical protein
MFAEEDDKAAMENARAVLSKQVYFTPGCVDEDAMEPTAEVYVARGWLVNGPDGSNTAATPSSNARCAGRRAEVRGVPRAEAQVRGIGASSPAPSLSSGLR